MSEVKALQVFNVLNRIVEKVRPEKREKDICFVQHLDGSCSVMERAYPNTYLPLKYFETINDFINWMEE